jgi:hypothetical protein
MFRCLIVFVLCIILLVGCAANPNPNEGISGGGDKEPAGFWLGLWQGFIVFFAFIVSLFKSSVGIYETYNTGFWYNFGFIIGVIVSHGGGAGILFRHDKNKKQE